MTRFSCGRVLLGVVAYQGELSLNCPCSVPADDSRLDSCQHQACTMRILSSPMQRAGFVATIASTVAFIVAAVTVLNWSSYSLPPQPPSVPCTLPPDYPGLKAKVENGTATTEEQDQVLGDESAVKWYRCRSNDDPIIQYTVGQQFGVAFRNLASASIDGEVADEDRSLDTPLAYYSARAMLASLFVWLLFDSTLGALFGWILGKNPKT